MYRFLKDSGFAKVDASASGGLALCVGLSERVRQELRNMARSYVGEVMAKLLRAYNVCLLDAARIVDSDAQKIYAAYRTCGACDLAKICPECKRTAGVREAAIALKSEAKVAHLGVMANMAARAVWYKKELAVAAVPVEVVYSLGPTHKVKSYKTVWVDMTGEIYSVEGTADSIYAQLRDLNLIAAANIARDAVARVLMLYERMGYAKRVEAEARPAQY